MKKLKKILEPKGSSKAHPSEDMLARFIDGKLGIKDRSEVIEHLAVCSVCYEVVQHSLGDIDEERRRTRRVLFRVSPNRRIFALAASLVFFLLVSSGLWYKIGYLDQKRIDIVAEIAIDDEMRELFLEDQSLVWQGEKAERFAELLVKRGVKAATDVDMVRLAGIYDPYRAKSLTKNMETVKITIENGMAFVEIVQDN